MARPSPFAADVRLLNDRLRELLERLRKMKPRESEEGDIPVSRNTFALTVAVPGSGDAGQGSGDVQTEGDAIHTGNRWL